MLTRIANSDVVAEFLYSCIIAQYGMPHELLSDHGTPFVSHVIATLYKKYNIRKLMSTPYMPQSNGIVERFMGYLKTLLITLCDNQPKRWDTYLSAILLAYKSNSTLRYRRDSLLPEQGIRSYSSSTPSLGCSHRRTRARPLAPRSADNKTRSGTESLRSARAYPETNKGPRKPGLIKEPACLSQADVQGIARSPH